MTDGKIYSYRWEAYGSIDVYARPDQDHHDKAWWAIQNLVTADAGTVYVKNHKITRARDTPAPTGDPFHQAAVLKDRARDYINERPTFVEAMRNTSGDEVNMSDYYRWAGHAEARRQLAEQLGWTVPHELGETTRPTYEKDNTK